MERFKKLSRFAIPAALVFLPLLVSAVTGGVTVPGVVVPPGTELTLSKIQDLIQTIASFIIVAGVIVAVIFIAWGGISLMMSRGDATKAKAAKEHIKYGIYGAAIILAVGVILNTTAALVTRTFFGAGQ